MQLVHERFDLLGLEARSVPSEAMIQERTQTVFAIGTAPFHQTGGAASANVFDLCHPIAQSVKADGLEAGFGIGLLTLEIGRIEFVSLLFCQAELSGSHAFIIRHLSEESIR